MSEEKKPDAAPAADKKADKKEGKKGGGTLKVIIMMTIFGAMAPFLLPSLVLLVGMFPTLVALFTDTDRNRSSTTAIGAMNAAGIVPFLIELWQKGQTMPNALAILQEPENWLVMIGAAALGQLIVFAVPQVIATSSLARAESRIGLLKSNLEKLKVTWGPEVATTKPVEKIVRGE